MTSSNSGVIIFNPSVDDYLRNAPPEFWDAVALAGILFGLSLAFQGKAMVRVALVFFGCFAGSVCTASILSWATGAATAAQEEEEAPAPTAVSPQVWLGVVVFGGALAGLVVDNVLMAGKVVVGLAIVLCLTGTFNQYIVANLPDMQQQAAIGALCCFVLVAWFLVVRVYDWALMYCTALGGGFLCLLGVGRLVRGPISPAAMYVNPELFLACEDWSCWAPLAIGAVVCLVGLRHQIKSARPPPPAAAEQHQQPLLI